LAPCKVDADEDVLAVGHVRSIRWSGRVKQHLTRKKGMPSTLVEDRIDTKIDHFFGNDDMWEQILIEIEVGPPSAAAVRALLERARATDEVCTVFRVDTPRQYPGMQYRRSKHVDDRCPHFAQRGSLVGGILEDGGRWLRVGRHFLPVEVDDITALVPVDPDALVEEDSLQAPEAICDVLSCDAPQRPHSVMMELPDATPKSEQ